MTLTLETLLSIKSVCLKSILYSYYSEIGEFKSNLAQRAQDMGKVLINVAGDGRCFFRAIHRQLHSIVRMSETDVMAAVDAMRARVISALKKDPAMVVCLIEFLIRSEILD